MLRIVTFSFHIIWCISCLESFEWCWCDNRSRSDLWLALTDN